MLLDGATSWLSNPVFQVLEMLQGFKNLGGLMGSIAIRSPFSPHPRYKRGRYWHHCLTF